MPKPEQIDFDDAHVGAVVLVPLDHRPVRHRGVLDRHDFVEVVLADHHAARMLAEMARQVLDAAARDGRRVCSAGSSADQPISAKRRGSGSPGSVNSKLFISLARRSICVGVEAERLADFARGAPAAVGDDVGGHRRAVAAVLFVDVLDDTLAPIAARQIEIDVGPLAALLGEEPLEQHPVLHGVHRRDAEAVADGAVRRRSASLDENVRCSRQNWTMSQTMRK